MRKLILTAFATATLAASLAVDAQALSVPRPIGLDAASSVTVVRDGCGWRRHYSRSAGRCVWDWRR